MYINIITDLALKKTGGLTEYTAVADPEFDLRGGVDQSVFSMVLAIFLFKSCLKLVASEEKIEKK